MSIKVMDVNIHWRVKLYDFALEGTGAIKLQKRNRFPRTLISGKYRDVMTVPFYTHRDIDVVPVKDGSVTVISSDAGTLLISQSGKWKFFKDCTDHAVTDGRLFVACGEDLVEILNSNLNRKSWWLLKKGEIFSDRVRLYSNTLNDCDGDVPTETLIDYLPDYVAAHVKVVAPSTSHKYPLALGKPGEYVDLTLTTSTRTTDGYRKD